MPDRELRDAEFRAFVLASAGRLHRTAYLLCGDRSLAEDLVQSALAKAYVIWPRMRSVEQPEAYVRRLLVNQRVSWWRRHRLTEVPLEHLPERPRPQSSTVEDRDELRKALLALGSRQRTAVVLRYYNDLTELETAAAMGCSVGNVKSLTSRGLRRLRELLGDDTPLEDHHAR